MRGGESQGGVCRQERADWGDEGSAAHALSPLLVLGPSLLCVTTLIIHEKVWQSFRAASQVAGDSRPRVAKQRAVRISSHTAAQDQLSSRHLTQGCAE